MSQAILLLSHHTHSKKIMAASRGEMGNAIKIKKFLNENGYRADLIDILEMFGNSLEALKEYYFPLSFTNFELAKQGYSIIEKVGTREVSEKIRKKILQFRPEILFILSWEYSLGALFGTGIQFDWPIISKLYVHYENECIPTPLFEPASLLVTESLHGSARAIACGIPSWKVVYFPQPLYRKVNCKNKKKFEIKTNKDTIVIGSVSRLVYGKNCEYILEVIKRLVDEGFPILFYLKGDLESLTQHILYSKWLENLIISLRDEKWFFWDKKYTKYEDMEKFYSSIDLFLHLSGFESGSNVIFEALVSQKPALILENPSNCSLFKNAALFVKKETKTETSTYFSVPNRTDLYQKLKLLISDSKLREELGKQGKEVALHRFCSTTLHERIPLLVKAAKAYHSKVKCDQIKKEIEHLYQQDLKRFEE